MTYVFIIFIASFNKLLGETTKDSKLRQKAFNQCWEATESKLEVGRYV